MYVALRYFIIGFIVATILNLLVYSQFSNNSSSSTSNKLQQLQKELRENIENDIIDCLEDDVLLDSKFPSHCVKNTQIGIPSDTTKPPPWKYKSKSNDRKLRVLFLYSHHWLDELMDRAIFQIFEAAKRSGKFERVEFWGENWPGWNGNLSIGNSRLQLGLNIENHFGSKTKEDLFDVFFTNKPQVHFMPTFPEESLYRKYVPINSIFYHETACSLGFGKCEMQRSTILNGFQYMDDINVGFFAYANAMIAATHFLSNPLGTNNLKPGWLYNEKLIMHLPHSAPHDIFYRPVEKERDIPFLIIGFQNNWYPERQNVTSLYTRGLLPKGTQVRSHPGYWFKDKNKEKLSVEQQTKEYADHLGRAKVVLVTSSAKQYAVRKYAEVALSGALLFGNIPGERQDEFRQFMVEFDAASGVLEKWESIQSKADSEEKIIEKINWWISHDKERAERAKIGQKIALKKYTYDAFVDGLLSGWNAYLRGERGAIYPHQYTIQGFWS